MKQKDLITYGLIGLAVYFLFMKKEDTATEDTTGGNNDTPELATNKGPGNQEPDAVFKDGSNTSEFDPSEFGNTSN